MYITLILAILAAGLYGLASLFSVIFFFRAAGSGEKKSLCLAAIGALCLVVILTFQAFISHHFPIFTPFGALVFYCLSITVIFLYVSIHHDTRSLSAMLIPYVTVLIFVATMHVKAGQPINPARYSIWLDLHVLTALVGYALFTLACAFAVTYLIQDRQLKRKHFGLIFQKLPALETLDKLIHGQIVYAFIVFTVSILLGVVLTHMNHWQTGWLTDPKVLATALTWFVYGVLFYLRLNADQHGRRMAIITIVGFICVLVTFFGVNMLTHSIHNIALTDYPGMAK
ncbi:MAG: cytochrome c biogenesis protein CcsA [Phycisphaerae bacterium]